MCRPDGRHVLNNQGTDDYVLTAFSQIRLTIRGIPADALWISSSALAVKTSWVHPE